MLCAFVVKRYFGATVLRDTLEHTHTQRQTRIQEKRHKPAVNFPPIKDVMVCDGEEMEEKQRQREGLKKYRDNLMSSGRTAEDAEQTHNLTLQSSYA